MRSLFFKLSLWSILTLAVCVGAVVFLAGTLNRNLQRGGPLGRTISVQTREAVRAFESGGRVGLNEYLSRLQEFFPERHFLLTASGTDLADGIDRREMLKRVEAGSRIPPTPGRHVWIVNASDNGQYRFVVELLTPVEANSPVPYITVILIAISGFSYALFRYLVKPVRELRGVLEQFGNGDLAARATVHRRDEFGELSRQFNDMAARIETLLGAERRLLEDISHELRSPLARMQFAIEGLPLDGQTATGVMRLQREVNRLSELVGHLLEVTRAEGDPNARQREMFDLKTLTLQILEDCRIEADAKQCELEFEMRGPITIIGDRELLRRAIENLLRNAIRHSPEDGRVEIKLDRLEDIAILEVRDHGPGVPQGLEHKIFEPFFRVDSSRTTSSGGVGLGLSIVKRAVRLHRGEIKAVNAGPGLRVEMSLPL